MSDHKPISIGGRQLSGLIHTGLTGLVAQIVTRLRGEMPPHLRLPGAGRDGEMTAVIAHSVRLFGDLLRERRLARPAELDRQRRSARRQAEEGVPLAALLEAYHVGAQALWQEIATDATAADLADLQTGQRLLLGYLRQLTTAVSTEYMETRQSLLDAEHDVRRSLITALLAGDTWNDPARYAGLPLATQYAVLVLATSSHPEEAKGIPAAGRRKIRRLQAVFENSTEELVLSVLDADGGVVLLPAPPGNPPPWTELRDLVQTAAIATGTDIIAAGALAPPAEVPAAVSQANDILALVRRLGYPAGLYRLNDVLLEYQLSRPSPARTELARLLDPLRSSPDLLRTLQVYLRNGLSRTRTAAELYVHPNTVDYRLRRIATLTGLNPLHLEDVQLLRAAVLTR